MTPRRSTGKVPRQGVGPGSRNRCRGVARGGRLWISGCVISLPSPCRGASGPSVASLADQAGGTRRTMLLMTSSPRSSGEGAWSDLRSIG